jgi:subtilase family serine protease
MGTRAALACGTALAVTFLTVAGSATAKAATASVTYPSGVSKMRPAARVISIAQATAQNESGQFTCQDSSGNNGLHCYSPTQVRAAYNVQQLFDAGRDGRGQTIVIIDAFSDPTVSSDLAKFDAQWGIPDPPSFKIVAPFGITPYNVNDPEQRGWSSEIAIDVEWAHAIAPGANIVLALAPTASDPDIVNTEKYVVQHKLGNVVSMSFGETERCLDPTLASEQHSLYSSATAKGITFVAAAGDAGAADLTCDGSSLIKTVDIPASDPFVTGVGGTNLQANLTTGAYNKESVWNEPSLPGAGGGGFSTLYSKPSYQSGVAGTARGVPDVTYSASLDNGLLVRWTSSGQPGSGWWLFAGTSVGTPQWAAIFAIADQAAGHGLGNVNTLLYGLSSADFHDIKAGDNSFANITGYTAVKGWDAASGIGSPIANLIVADLSK